MNTDVPEDDWSNEFRGLLLDWFDDHARDLPWRGVDDPYLTWVSEIMLQQTQVATVEAYFERWIDRFPTVASLAGADLDDVLKLWEGLGYYRRARYLHRGAQMVAEEFDGALPATVAELKKIPGIGPYTAGAIASIAFDEPAPIVDGNVTRILSRLQAWDIQPRERTDQKRLWALAEHLVPDKRPGDFNQAMMELGATVCTPKKPTCLVCPVRKLCAGFATGEPTAFPRVARRTASRSAAAKTAIVVDEAAEAILVEQRPETGLLAGLWQFPTEDDATLDEFHAAIQSRGIDVLEREPIGEVSHTFTHIEMTIEVARYHVAQPVDVTEKMRWIGLDELDEIALSTAMRKVEQLLRDHLG